MTTCAIQLVEDREIVHFLGPEFDIGFGRFAWWLAAGAKQERDQTYGEGPNKTVF